MRRLDFRPVASVILAIVVLAYVGCSGDPASNTGPNPQRRNPPRPIACGRRRVRSDGLAIDKLMTELNNPAALLIVSGQQEGYLEPCGCSAEQIGGLLRRFDFIEQLRKKNWPVVARRARRLDQGSCPRAGRIRAEQDQVRLCPESAQTLGYEAMALSADDLKVGVGEAMGLFDNNLGDKTKIVVANVQPEQIYEKLFRSSIVVAAGPVKLGVTAVIDPETLQKLSDPDKDVTLTAIKPPDEVLPGVLADLESKSDYQVLMVQGPPALAKRLGEAYPGFDVVVCDLADGRSPGS